jgi:hypothetical protein
MFQKGDQDDNNAIYDFVFELRALSRKRSGRIRGPAGLSH